MKALKEKRIGVRSLLRRGLIILSLFALVFAVACGGDDGSSTTPTPDPDPGTTPPPAARTVTNIVVLSQPSEASFQGAPPNLTGLVARVYWSDNAAGELVTDPTKFVAIPPYCDDGGTAITNETENPDEPDITHGIAYVGHTEKTAGITIPYVVPLLGTDVPADGKFALQLTGTPARQAWYSDEIPDFTGLKLEGMYEPYFLSDGTKKIDQKKDIPITTSYPFICGLDTFDPATRPILSLGIGYDGTTKKDDIDAYTELVSFNIEKFVRATSMEVDYTTSTFGDYFDDDLKLYDDPPADILADLITNNTLNLTVSYFDGTQRTITFDEYLSNLAYFNSRYLTADRVDPIAAQQDGKTNQAITNRTVQDILVTREDDAGNLYYNLSMNYVPSVWGKFDDVNDATDAWLHNFDIQIPVYAFNTAVTARKEGSGISNVRVTAQATATTPVPVDPDWKKKVTNDSPDGDVGDYLMQALSAKWELIGTYDRAGVQKTKKIALTPQMFADGLVTASPFQGVPATTAFSLDKTARAYDTTIPVGGLTTGKVGRNYVLPIWYRGERLNDQEMDVVVDLVGP